jgi:hypothetical protein
MRQTQLYVLFWALFLIPIAALLTGQLGWFLVGLVLSVGIGAIADRLDNKLSEPYKKYNQYHHHHHPHNNHAA